MDTRKALAEARKALADAKAKRLQSGLQAGTPAISSKDMPSELKKSLNKWGVKSLNQLMEVNPLAGLNPEHSDLPII